MDVKQIFQKSRKSQNNNNSDNQRKRSVESLIQFYEHRPLFYNKNIEKENSSKKKSGKTLSKKLTRSAQHQIIVQSSPELHKSVKFKEIESQDKGTNYQNLMK